MQGGLEGGEVTGRQPGQGIMGGDIVHGGDMNDDGPDRKHSTGGDEWWIWGDLLSVHPWFFSHEVR